MDIYGDFVVIDDDKSYGKDGEIMGISTNLFMEMLWWCCGYFIEIHGDRYIYSLWGF